MLEENVGIIEHDEEKWILEGMILKSFKNKT